MPCQSTRRRSRTHVRKALLGDAVGDVFWRNRLGLSLHTLACLNRSPSPVSSAAGKHVLDHLPTAGVPNGQPLRGKCDEAQSDAYLVPT